MTDSQIDALGKVPIILDGTFFRIVKHTEDGKVMAKCVTCQKIYGGTLPISSNFLKHLKEKHHTLMPKYEAHKITTKAPRDVPVRTTASDVQMMPESSEATPSTSTAPPPNMFRKGWQKKADMLVTNLIVHNALPMRLVEMPEFKHLVSELSTMPQAVHCLSMKTANKCIDERYCSMKADILDKLKKTSFVCTTADIWSSRRRSFLGVTVHWLNECFQRESYAIACLRFRGTHDFNAIACLLRDAHLRYGLNASKIIYTVTDNASNMVKAFRVHGIIVADDDDDEPQAGGSEAESVDESDAVELIDYQELAAGSEGDHLSLPPHFRCASHTLNLVVTADIEKAVAAKKLTAHNFGSVQRAALGVCAQHWNMLNRSANKASEAFIVKFGHLVRLPCPTRWNSLYDALSDIVQLDPPILREFSEEQRLTPFTDVHTSFLKEYVQCLRPIADALDKLQGEKQVILGDLIPCIMNAHFLLRKLQQQDLRFCKGVINTILKSLETRFAIVFEWDTCKKESFPFLMATITSPALKMWWIDTAAKKALATQWLTDEVQSLDEEQSNSIISCNDETVTAHEYEFMATDEANTDAESEASLQIAQFLHDKTTQLASLKKYRLIEQVFFKYNAGIFNSVTFH